jgi:hypothetical protein
VDERGGESLHFYLLFGVIMAMVLAAVFAVQLRRQAEVAVDWQAQNLANSLARTAFTAVKIAQQTFDLPASIVGSLYELSVDVERSSFVVRIIDGIRAGSTYFSAVNLPLFLEDSNFRPGSKIYFQRLGDRVIVSASPIETRWEKVTYPTSSVVPEFYGWAKVNVREAVVAVAAYFFAREFLQASPTGKVLDVVSLDRADNFIIAHVGYRDSGTYAASFRAVAVENGEKVGMVSRIWMITKLENFKNEAISPTPCPSIENAASSNWLFSPSQLLRYLRSRTWRDEENNLIEIPQAVRYYPAAAYTNVSIYPTWIFEFEANGKKFKFCHSMMLWFYGDNDPGFVFQSNPLIWPVT